MYNILAKKYVEIFMADTRKKRQSRCEDCVYYDFDDDMDGYVCTVNLDEDEAVDFISGRHGSCPYYRFYDEYKSVQKQN